MRRARIHKRRSSSLQAGSVKNEINVTPLVDVVLVLLIIFMVVTPMLSRGVKVDLPETVHHDKKNDTGSQIVVSISADGKAFIGADPAEGDELVRMMRKELSTKTKEGGPRDVHVKADRRLAYADVRKVLERIHEAGAPSVALGTEERKKEGKK